MRVIASYWELAIKHRELSSVLFNDLEGWGGGTGGGGVMGWYRGDICIPIATSLCCTPEANTTL